jgi:hypothetical protein
LKVTLGPALRKIHLFFLSGFHRQDVLSFFNLFSKNFEELIALIVAYCLSNFGIIDSQISDSAGVFKNN